MAKNPLIRSYPKKVNKPLAKKSSGILDDHAQRETITTKEGSITKTPVDDIDIVNKKYSDDQDQLIKDLLASDYVPYTGAIKDVDLGSYDLTADGFESSLDVVTNGDFDTDSDWTKQASWTISDGKARYLAGTDGHTIQPTVNPVVANEKYILTFDYVQNVGFASVTCGGTLSENLTGSGSREYIFTSSDTSNLIFTGRTNKLGGDCTIDNVVLKKYSDVEGKILMQPGSEIRGNIGIDSSGDYDVGNSTYGLRRIYLDNYGGSTAPKSLPDYRGFVSEGEFGDILVGNDNVFPSFYGQRTVAHGSTANDNSDDYTNLYQGNSGFPYGVVMWDIPATRTADIPDNGWIFGGGLPSDTNPCPIIQANVGVGSATGTAVEWCLDVEVDGRYKLGLIQNDTTDGITGLDLFDNVAVDLDGSVTGRKVGAFVYADGNTTTISTINTWTVTAGTKTIPIIEDFSAATTYTPGIKYDGALTQAFEISWHISYEFNKSATNVHFGVYKNGALISGSAMQQFGLNINQPYALSGTCVVELSTGDEIQLVTQADKTGTLTILHETSTIKEFFD
jgi:hypothetical protein